MHQVQKETGAPTLTEEQPINTTTEIISRAGRSRSPATRTALVLCTALVVLALDQLTKATVRQFLLSSGTYSTPLIGEWVKLTYVENRGAAFGLLQNQSAFFILVGVIVVAGILVGQRFVPTHQTALAVCLGMQLGGATGNMIDRMRFGHVFDFVDLTFWPVFNVADSAIVVGVAILAYHLFTSSDQHPKSDDLGQ